jgi:hypothetical protein
MDNNLIDLGYLDEYISLFNEHNQNQILDPQVIYRPERFSREDFDATCTTDSMKRGLTYFVKQYNEHVGDEKMFDIIALKNDDIINAFVFVKKYVPCIPGEGKSVISIEGICSNVAGSGKKLLGFIIYNALRNDFPLILQVDNGYSNIGAYCLYSSMGFEVDVNLLNGCYNFDPNKLVMKLNNTITPETMFVLEKKPVCYDKQLQTEDLLRKRQINYILAQLDRITKKSDQRKLLKNLGLNFIIDLLTDEFRLQNYESLKNILYNETFLDNIYSFLKSKNITFNEAGKNIRFNEAGKNKLTKKHIKKNKHKTLRKQKNKHK